MNLFVKSLIPSLAALTATSAAQIPAANSMVLSGKTAFGMAGPRMIADGGISSLAWSDDGRFLLAVRSEMGRSSNDDAMVGPQAILIYSVADRTSRVMWRANSPTDEIEEVHWLKGADAAIAIVREHLRTTDPRVPHPMRSEVYSLDASTGASRGLLQVDATEENGPVLGLSYCPAKPFAVLTLFESIKDGTNPYGRMHSRIRKIGPGSIGGEVEIDGSGNVVGWIDDGGTPLMAVLQRDVDGHLLRQAPQAMDFSTGKLRAAPNPIRFKLAEPSLPISVSTGAGKASKGKEDRKLRSLWLSGDDSSALIAADGIEPQLSPSLSGVAYISQGVALVRPIVQVPKEAYLAAKAAAEREKIMDNAKQVALALLQYATDKGDVLPPNQSDVLNLISPFLSGSDVAAGFVYSFSGGNLGDIANPASTVLGYIAGSNGRAIVYSDGHVKWQANP